MVDDLKFIMDDDPMEFKKKVLDALKDGRNWDGVESIRVIPIYNSFDRKDDHRFEYFCVMVKYVGTGLLGNGRLGHGFDIPANEPIEHIPVEVPDIAEDQRTEVAPWITTTNTTNVRITDGGNLVGYMNPNDLANTTLLANTDNNAD